MANLPSGVENRVREVRLGRGWSQEELARRSGLSRAGVGAIETGRLVPSVAGALGLASAFGCRVEDLFAAPLPATGDAEWAWSPARTPCRYRRAEVGGRTRLYPAEASPWGIAPHDGVASEPGEVAGGGADPRATLVLASCDPALGLLAAELARAAGVRLLAIPRSSRAALDLLGRGVVHVAGVHLAEAGEPGGNAGAIRSELGAGYSLIRVARWEEGVAVAPGRGFPSADAAARADLRWVGREEGSGARLCQDEVLGRRRRPPERTADDHRGVADAIRQGWADAGVCLRLVVEESGLDFLDVRRAAYDLCFADRDRDDPRIRALVEVVRSPAYLKALGELPGYDGDGGGELDRVT